MILSTCQPSNSSHNCKYVYKCVFVNVLCLMLQMYNLGTGAGVSVLQLVKVFEQVTGTTVPYEIVERRTGDITSMYANPQLAEQELAWKASHSLEEMCK